MDKVFVTRSSMPPMEEYIEEISDMWETHWLTNMGVKHQKLQEKLKEYLEAEHLELLTNGHMALELTLQALNLKGEVITTPFTFASTTHAIVRNGLTPVFCDINPTDFTIDATKIEDLITERTSAIVPVHVYGNICNIETIDEIAKKHNLRVVYDAAHAFGEKYHGKGIGSFGDASCFSFHATKVFNTIEGGAVSFHDSEFGKHIYRLKNFGIQGPEVVDGVGTNAKMNEFCAAMGLCNLRHIDEELNKRRRLVEIYRARLENIEGVQLNCVQEGVTTNYSYFPVVINPDTYGKTRDEVFRKLEENEVYARKYFYPLTSAFDCYRGQFNPEETPCAYRISNNVLTLPLYSDLAPDQVEKICELII